MPLHKVIAFQIFFFFLTTCIPVQSTNRNPTFTVSSCLAVKFSVETRSTVQGVCNFRFRVDSMNFDGL